MKNSIGFIVLFLMALAMASPPEMPSAFYGVVTTASGTPNGQAFTASINGSSTSTVIGPTSTYSCGASICNYYMTISRKAGDAASSEIVFSINGNALQQKGTFSQGAIVRLDFPDVPQSYLACLSNCQSGDSGLGSSSSTGSSGGGGGGSSSAASTRSTTDVNVDVGGMQCTVSIEREMESSNTSSVLTTTLTNTGGSECTMANYVFIDTVPSDFAQMSEISFSPSYDSTVGAKVAYTFLTFAGGESKTLTYTVARWVSPRRASAFTDYSMSAMKPALSAPAPEQQPVVPAPVPTQPVAQPVKTVVAVPAVPIPRAITPPANVNLLTGALFDSNGGLSFGALSALAIASFVALAGLVFGLWRKIRRN